MTAQVKFLADYRPSAYSIDRADLAFQLDPARTLVHASLQMRREAQEPLVLDGEELELLAVRINGRALDAAEYEVTPTQLTIQTTPAEFLLETEVALAPAANTALMGLYLSAGRLTTQCESQGFRRITWYLDRPDVLSVYTVRMEADAARFPTLLSNGDCTDSGPLPGGRHFAVWHDPFPKPSYLFALVAGEFETIRDRFVTASGQEVALSVHVDAGNGHRALFAMDTLKRSMAWDEQRFGREYDLSQFHIVAVHDFNYGAMENKSLNIFNASAVLADVATETDEDFSAVERIVAHEYFHNWTGNRVTLRDWFQICLKEGLTVYRDQEFMSEQHSRAVRRIRDVRHLRQIQFPEDAGPLSHPVRPDSFAKIENFYTPTVYRKGAEVIRVLSALLGPDRFARGMDRYFDQCDGRAVTVEEFVGCFEDAGDSSVDLDAFFNWYRQAGTPHVSVRRSYDANAGTLRLEVAQATAPTPGQPAKRALPVPLRVGFLDTQGQPLALRLDGENAARDEHRLVLDADAQGWTFVDVPEPAIPAVLRGFMAPVTLDDGLGDDERLVQMAHEPDSFTRWDAGQKLIASHIIALSEAEEDEDNEALFASLEKVAQALEIELDRAAEDPAFAALALEFPNLPDLVQQAEHPDPDRLLAASSHVRVAIAERLGSRLVEIVRAPGEPDTATTARARGERALKSAALRLLATVADRHPGLLYEAFENAGNMTLQLTALSALSLAGGEDFDRALAAFETQWRDQPLVMDKWFAVQAAARRTTAATIAELASHPLFELRNPNRVRSLYGTFGTSNLRAFHAADGSGYALMADIVQRVDALNPMVAGRLVRAFESWRRFDAERQQKALAALQSIKAAPGLSAMLSELVEKLTG